MLGGQPAARSTLPDPEGLHGECGRPSSPIRASEAVDLSLSNYWQLALFFLIGVIFLLLDQQD